MLPSGSALLKLRAVMILFTSLSILLATPGYWKNRSDCVTSCCIWSQLTSVFYLCANARLTWIFMATSLPSFSLAKCTWPMDAAANGFSSKYSSLSLQLGPRSLLMAFCRERTNGLSFELGLLSLCCLPRLCGPYHHLLRGHEVCALSNTLEDFGQLRVDEGVIWEEITWQMNRVTIKFNRFKTQYFTAILMTLIG